MKILIVEDEDILSRVLKEKLEKEKLTVDTVMNGNNVISSVKSFKPDLILLDIVLPKINGLEILGQIRADQSIANIPVLVLSNLGDDQSIKAALKLGAVDYFVKTQHPLNEIVEKIKDNLLKAK